MMLYTTVKRVCVSESAKLILFYINIYTNTSFELSSGRLVGLCCFLSFLVFAILFHSLLLFWFIYIKCVNLQLGCGLKD